LPSAPRFVIALVLPVVVLLSGCSSAVEGPSNSAGEDEIAEPESPVVEPSADVQDDQAVELALAFMDARDRRDADAILEMLSPDVVARDFGFWPRGYEDYPSLTEWMDIFDWRWTVDECTALPPGSSSDSSTRVGCTHVMANEWSRAQGVDPVPGQITLLVEDGQIVELENDTGQWVPLVFAGWLEWLEREHPDDITVLYRHDDEGRPRGGPATDPEALDLYRRYVVEYVEFERGQRETTSDN
jgi:hypothetical protein